MHSENLKTDKNISSFGANTETDPLNKSKQRRTLQDRNKGSFALQPTTVNHFTGKRLNSSRSGSRISP